MIPFSDEEIIAFLMGEADSVLASRIQRSMLEDADLVSRVSHLRSVLNHLNGSGGCFEPPSGLIEATLQRVDALDGSTFHRSDDSATEPPEQSDIARPASLGAHFVDRGPSESSQASSPLRSTRFTGLLSLARGWGRQNRVRNLMDSTALSISLVCLSCLVLPAMLRARFESRRAQCAENLRLNGQALFTFAMQRSDRRFPEVSASGPEAFAGIYAVRLYNMGLLGSSGQLRCVSLLGSERPAMCSLSEFPSIEQLRVATQQQLNRWQQVLGGDYAYNLGVWEDSTLVAPRNTGSSHFAILADAPIVESDTDSWPAHEGHGVNILYDDGHVEFASSDCFEESFQVRDHPYCNRFGLREAGLDDTDASLAPSYFPPLEPSSFPPLER